MSVKLISIFMVCSLLLSACGSIEPASMMPPEMETELSVDEASGITMSIASIGRSSCTLSFVQSGDTGYTRIEYDGFSLSHWTGEGWEVMQKLEQGTVADVGQIVPFDAESTVSVYWETIYGGLETGYYRIHVTLQTMSPREYGGIAPSGIIRLTAQFHLE